MTYAVKDRVRVKSNVHDGIGEITNVYKYQDHTLYDVQLDSGAYKSYSEGELGPVDDSHGLEAIINNYVLDGEKGAELKTELITFVRDWMKDHIDPIDWEMADHTESQEWLQSMGDPSAPMPRTKEELIELLASIEHERWADWQKYVHSICSGIPDWLDHVYEAGSLVIPDKRVQGWQRQINTPYEELSDGEKGNDRDQVKRYWPIIVAFVERWLEAQSLSGYSDWEFPEIWREEME